MESYKNQNNVFCILLCFHTVCDFGHCSFDPASGPQASHDDRHANDGERGAKRKQELVEDIGNGKS